MRNDESRNIFDKLQIWKTGPFSKTTHKTSNSKLTSRPTIENYFRLGFTNGLVGENVDTVEVWNSFLQNSGEVIFYQFLIISITLLAIWKGAKAIEKANVILMTSLFILLFMTLGLSLWMDMSDGTLDGFLFMFTVDWDQIGDPEIWINGLSQSAWSCSAGMGMAITYAVYMRKD